MPTAKPRVMVTLEARQHQVLASINKSTGQSMSSIVGELVDQAMPVLERIALTFTKLCGMWDAKKATLVHSMEAAQAAFEPLAQEAVGQFDLFLARVEGRSGSAGLPRSGSPARAASVKTPPTNRGVTPHPRKRPKAKPGAASQPFRSKAVFSKKGGRKP